MKRASIVCMAWVALAAGAGFQTLWAQQRTLKPGFNLFSKEQDIQLGKEAAAEIEKQVRLVNNAQLAAYVEKIGRKLGSQPQADNYPYTFKVVADKEINAFALPGGPTYVNTGLIMAADNEAQLAGVMAHEISHVALRHGTNQASKANLIQLPALLGGALAGGALLGNLAQIGIGLGANSVLMKFSRNAERDADLLGTRLVAQAGYNPLEMARFFEKLEAQHGNQSGLSKFLSSHPNPGNRVASVQQEIKYLPKADYAGDTGELARMKQIISGLPEVTAAAGKPAASIPEARPSGNLRGYQGKGFSISHPENWQVSGDAKTMNQVFAAPAGVVRGQGGGSQILYGAMTGLVQTKESDLDRNTTAFLEKLQQENRGMKIAQNPRRMQVDGQPALITTLVSPSGYEGQREIDTALTVERPGGLFFAVFIAPESDFNQVQSVFRQMLRSIRFQN